MTDSTGANVFSAQVTIQSGDNGCLGASSIPHTVSTAAEASTSAMVGPGIVNSGIPMSSPEVAKSTTPTPEISGPTSVSTTFVSTSTMITSNTET